MRERRKDVARGSHISFFPVIDCYDGDQRYFFNSAQAIEIKIRVINLLISFVDDASDP